MAYDSEVTVPANARAAIVAPTLVSGRFVQLDPVYTSGPALPDDATIPLSRTVTPVEWDRVVGDMTQLSNQLGPQNGQVTGALGRALDSAQANLAGQGNQINDTIRNASGAMTTLAAGGQDLFGTVRNLATVTSSLAQNDAAVQAFGRQLAQVSAALASDRDSLAAVLQALNQASGLIQNFIRDNQGQLNTDLNGLSTVAKHLADNRQALGDLLQRAPVGISNFNNVYDPVSATIDGAFGLTNMSDPASFVCSLIFAAGGHNDDTNRTCEAAITPFVQVLKMNNIPLVFPIQTAPNGGHR
jgi:phospholipid/cholesterol/gamma-HCH transport system substrate-binding protein